MKICVIGYGTVGKAVVAALDIPDEIDYVIVDPAYKEHDISLKEIIKSCDAAIICVDTPKAWDGNSLDDTNVQRLVNKINLYKVNSLIPILIKSTLTMGTLGEFKLRGLTNVCYSPEFLRNDYALEDFLSETKFIIGGELDQAQGWANVFSQCQPIRDEAFLDLAEAGVVKFAENAFLALRVTFFNELYNLVEDLQDEGYLEISGDEIDSMDSCARSELHSHQVFKEMDYDSIVYALGLDDRIGHSHNQVPGPDGKFGWGGHCLPKDVLAFTDLASETDSPLSLLESAIKLNDFYRNEKKHGPERRKEED